MLLTRCVRCLTCKGKRKSKYKARLLNFSVFTNYMYVIESSSARLLEHFKIVYSWVSVQVINFIIWNSKVQATIINFWFFFSFCSLNVVNNLENLKPDAITLIKYQKHESLTLCGSIIVCHTHFVYWKCLVHVGDLQFQG